MNANVLHAACCVIVLAICAIVRAEPDIPGAIEAAERIQKRAEAAEARAKAMEGLYDNALSSRIAADKAHAQAVETLRKEHAGEIASRDGRIAELEDARAKGPAYVNFGLSAIVMLAAVAVGIFGDMRSAARLLCVSLVCSAIGYAMLMLGLVWAWAGLGIALTCVIGVVVFEIRAKQQHKVAGEEIIDGLQQAMNVGEVTLTPGLRAILNAAQSSFTKKRVDQITKGRK